MVHLGISMSYVIFIIAFRQFYMGKSSTSTDRILNFLSIYFLYAVLTKIFRIWPLLSMKKNAKQMQRLKDEQERLVRNEIPHAGHPQLHHTIKPPSMIVNGMHGHRNDRGIDGSGTSKTSNSTRLTILNDSYSWFLIRNDVQNWFQTWKNQFFTIYKRPSEKTL